jgi:hypothetical protein
MKRYLPYIVAVSVLAGINLVRWLTPAHSESQPRATVAARLDAADFRVHVATRAAQEHVAPRDLFYVPAPARSVRVAAPHVVAPPAPPPKTPEQIAEEEARAALGALRVIGIAFRGGRGQAYVSAGEESYLVMTGDKIGNRFEVGEITADYVAVKDPVSGIDLKVPLQGQ